MKTTSTISLFFLLFSSHLSAQCWQNFSTAPYHNLAQKSDGTLWAWGTNFSGQLGNGFIPNQSLPIQVGTDTDWQLTSGGAFHSLAIKNNGTLWGWGWNDDGQLGIGAATTGINPLLQVGSENNWRTVAAGGHHTVAIKNDGSLWAWGRNDHGQVGIGIFIADKVSPVQIGTVTDWNQIAAGLSFAAAIKNDGTLWTWGENQKGQLGNASTNDNSIPVQIGSANWEQVATGYSHTVAVKTNGTLWAWGDNSYGQLGSGSYIDQKTPIQIGSATNWKQVRAGLGHTIALKTDGTIWAWGWNEKGQLGNGSNTTQNAPVQISSATDWQQIGAGEVHTMALKNDGTLWAWGWNQYGQLGDGTTADKNVPTQIACPVTGVKESLLISENFQIAPNPAHDYFTLETIALNDADLTFEVTTLPGQVAIKRQTLPVDRQIDVSALPNGVYLVILHGKNGRATRQFVKY